MRRILTHPLLLSVLAAAAVWIVFAYLIDPPLPKSLLVQYMVICVIGIVLVATFDETTAMRTSMPIVALLGNPEWWMARAVAFVVVVGGVGFLAFSFLKPSLEAPIELRTVHPAPPSKIKVYGKSYDLLTLENPLRKSAPQGSDDYAALVKEGGETYYKNCIYCHGDLLDGAGPFGKGLNPRPANFQDVGTIAQLQESYLFWRITTGGPGLPREGAPWASAMPVWHEMLEEEDVWKIILFLYDYTGFEPRSWELDAADSEADGEPAETDAPENNSGGELDSDAVLAVYERRCSHCHGEEGDGLGPAADYMYPKPRDFTFGTFKYKTTHADDEFPTDDDLRKTIEDGLAGTAMPGWKSILNDAEVTGLIQLIKEFGYWEEEEPENNPIEQGTPVASSPESIERGTVLFTKACVQCHGEAGRGNITSGKKLKDDWEDRIWPRNLTRPESWRRTVEVQDVFQRVSTGIRGTPMPEHTTTMPEQDRWDIANYVMTLRDKATAPAAGETVLRAARVSGALPGDPDDPAWETAAPINFPLVPNVIKEPRLFFSLNETVTVRALFNGEAVALRLDVDDRTYSVPGHELEARYAIEDGEATADAVAVQLPRSIPVTSEKPWFRHGDGKRPVNMWYWRAPSVTPEQPESVVLLDAEGPDGPPRPREEEDGGSGLSGTGVWSDGQWRVVFSRPLATENAFDLQFEVGRYVPIAFANWDGVAGQKDGRHTTTTWYWLLLEPDADPVELYSLSGGAAGLAGLAFVLAARRMRRRYAQNV